MRNEKENEVTRQDIEDTRRRHQQHAAELRAKRNRKRSTTTGKTLAERHGTR